jgi:Xaa-Pro aminopeptidase
MREEARRERAMAAAEAAGAAALLVTHGADVRYLTGFTGSSGAVALVRGGKGKQGKVVAALFTDGRYTTQAKAEAAGVRVVIDKKAPGAQAAAWLAAAGVERCGFDAAHTTVTALEGMRKAIPGSVRRSFFMATVGLVARLREVKDTDEIRKMKKAAALGCTLFAGALEFLAAGMAETEVAGRMEFAARMGGAEGMSFETIVTGGKRTALPHGRASRAKLPARGFCTLDFGVLLEGYCSDMTRTVHLGNASRGEWDVYHSVLEAQMAAVAAVGPGVACGDVDEAARSVLRKAKLGKAFSHSTGHGVGLEIHEGPRVATRQEQKLEPGMVITIEPGAYLAGEFGIRIEDMVLVTEKGSDVLTSASPKAWIEIE